MEIETGKHRKPIMHNHIELASKMKVGDSVFDEAARIAQHCKFYNTVKAYYHAGKIKMKFSAKKQDGGVRVWRVE